MKNPPWSYVTAETGVHYSHRADRSVSVIDSVFSMHSLTVTATGWGVMTKSLKWVKMKMQMCINHKKNSPSVLRGLNQTTLGHLLIRTHLHTHFPVTVKSSCLLFHPSIPEDFLLEDFL